MSLEDLLTGYIPPEQRTQEQADLDNQIKSMMPRFSLPYQGLAKGEKVRLTDSWAHPLVVADVGFVFDRFVQLTGSCFIPGTKVRMSDGTEKNIEDIQVGNSVFSHSGNVRRVTKTFHRKYTGKLYTFHVKGWDFPVTMTHDHDCLLVDSDPTRTYRHRFGSYAKRKAETVKVGERFLLPYLSNATKYAQLDLATLLSDVEATGVDQVSCTWRDRTWDTVRHIEVDDDLGWLLGLYLADGSLKHNKVIYHLNTTTKAVAAERVKVLVQKIFGQNVVVYTKNEEGEANLKVVIHNGVIARLFRHLVPGIVYTKKVPGVLVVAPKSVKLATIQGWMNGDGHFQDRGAYRSLRGVSTSTDLIRGMGQLALSCGLRPSVLQRKKRADRKESYDLYLTGDGVNQIYPDQVATLPKVTTRPRLLEQTPYGFSTVVTKIDVEEVVDHPVYCCEVEEEHSLIVNGIAQHQCVGVGAGNAVFSLSGTQRLLSQNPTKAFVPWWGYPYGRSRFYAGMLRPGSGSFGSAMAKALITDGVFDDKQPGLPAFSRTDGLQLTEALELQWSDGDSSLVEGWLETGRKYPVGAATEVRDTSGLETEIMNGYPATFACNYYPGSGQIMGSGENACLVGKFDTYGPHQVSIHSVWNNPDLGLLFWMQNSWPKSVYPRDPAGGPVCGLWVKENDMQAAFRYSAECFLLSHLNWFPAQPEVLNYFV